MTALKMKTLREGEPRAFGIFSGGHRLPRPGFGRIELLRGEIRARELETKVGCAVRADERAIVR